jgi:membrane-associated phospholipid phosphatase
VSDVKVLCVVWLGLVVVLGITATIMAPRFSSAWFERLSARFEPVTDTSMRFLGRTVTAITALFAGAGVTIAICWVLGVFAGKVEPDIDHPVFRWFASRQDADWSDIWLKITNIGSPLVTQRLSILGAVLFGLIWLARKDLRARFWVPPLMFAVAYCLEKFGQQALKLVVDRGHPPTTFGTWPSGGCARIIIIYGLLMFFAVKLYPNPTRRMWFAGWSVVAFFDAVQAYSRMYNQEHWLTDVIGGMIYGTMLAIVLISFYRVLMRVPVSHPELMELTGADGSRQRPATERPTSEATV